MNKPILWTSGDADKATGGNSSALWAASGLSIDSRSLQPGDLFVALTGPNFDGHDFVQDAFDRGATVALVSRRPDGVDQTAPLLRVADTLDGLRRLAGASRARTGARICAVTGSVGKTSTKEALKLALSGSGETYASAGNLNNHWGAPLSLARMPIGMQYGIFELGMNHAGEIEPLSRLVRPNVTLITNVEAVHLEFFDSVDDIADAKAEIFAGIEPGGVAVLPRDKPIFARLAQRAREAGVKNIISFGADRNADARLTHLSSHPTCSCISADIFGQAVTYKVGAPGLHWAHNSLGRAGGGPGPGL